MMEKRRLERERERERRRRKHRIWLHHESVEGTAENAIRDRWRVFGSGCVYYCIYTLCAVSVLALVCVSLTNVSAVIQHVCTSHYE